MWRVSEELTARVDSAKPLLEAKLRVRLSRTQVIDFLLDAGLRAAGLEPPLESTTKPETDDLNDPRR